MEENDFDFIDYTVNQNNVIEDHNPEDEIMEAYNIDADDIEEEDD